MAAAIAHLRVKLRAMKTLFTTSLVCSVASLLGLVGLSAMSVAPGAEVWRWGMMFTLLVFLIAWLRLVFWARGRLRGSPGGSSLPTWLSRSLVVGGVVYVLLVLLCSFG